MTVAFTIYREGTDYMSQKQFTQADVFAAIEEGSTAFDLLLDHMPGAHSRLDRIDRSLKKYLDDVRQVFPDANFYSANGTVHLLLGESHSGRSRTANNELSATIMSRIDIGGGDW